MISLSDLRTVDLIILIPGDIRTYTTYCIVHKDDGYHLL